MKKIIFSLMALVCCMSMSAQVIMVMKGNTVVATYNADEADNVVFVAPVSGTAKATIGGSEVDVKWIQLWEDGPKFAEYNVGVTDGKAESTGGYYFWGGSIDKDPQHKYKEGNAALTGADDTATNLWGGNWRMPKKEEFKDLIAHCDCEWTTVNGVTGRKFTGKVEPYKSNSIFLPATGYYQSGNIEDNGTYGSYWSSTPNNENMTHFLFISDTYRDVLYVDRHYGYPVRAILAEEYIAPINGTAKATIGGSEVDVKWIQLWKNGPKFAEYNVGVTDGKAESAGGYYYWGGSIDKDPQGRYKEGDAALAGTDDTATNLWGTNWRMPTKEELDDLIANCYCEWTTVNGVTGCKFTGKEEPYNSNCIFLPTAGYYGGSSVQGSAGNYWSSTPYNNQSTFFIHFFDGTENVFSTGRSYGYSVRAILVEQ